MFSELRLVLRGLARNPGFSAVAILVLSLGIGANTAVFSVANVMLLHPLPFPHPERLVLVWEKRAQDASRRNGVSPADYLDWRAQSRSFAALDAGNQKPFNLTGAGKPERVMSSIGTSQLLATYGIQPVLGRGFTEADEEGDGHVVALSYRLWKRRFNGEPNAVGQTIRLDEEPYRVIGVLPNGFRTPYGKEPDIYVPWTFTPADRQDRTEHRLLVIGRLRPGYSLAQAQAEMDVISNRIALAYPAQNAGHSANPVRLSDETTSQIRPALLVLLITVGFLLLLASANTANLVLARATVREREIAIRQALGASRGQLVRLLLMESIALALAGGVAGVLVAKVALWLMPLRQEAVGVPAGLDAVTIDTQVLVFTLGISVLTGIFFGLAPVLQFARLGLGLRTAARAYSTDVRGRSLRRALVVGEVAIACTLLIGASLLIRSFVKLVQMNPGFQMTNRLSLEFSLPQARYSDQTRQLAFYDEILRRVSALPPVNSAALTTFIPGASRGALAGFRIEGQPEPHSPENIPMAFLRVVSNSFLSTMAIPILRGRGFNSEDRLDSEKVVVVSESMARRYFSNSDPIGKRIEFTQTPGWLTVIGITGNMKPIGRAAYGDPGAELYQPLSQRPLSSPDIALIVQASQDPLLLTKAVVAEVAKIDPDLPAGRVRTIEQVVEESVGLARFQTMLVAAFAGIALLLAAGGLYSVMAYLVTQRTREVGIRVALGATQSDVLRLVLREGALLGLCGIVLGLTGAIAAGRVLKGFLVGVSINDPLIFAGVALLLLAVALAASVVPAWRATRLDPAVALRCE